MPLIDTFNSATTETAYGKAAPKQRRKRPAPFSIRLSDADRARLAIEAAGAPLGAYIKAKVLGEAPLPMRRTGLSVEDRQAHARALALLGQTRLASNLNQIAHAVNIGVLPVTPETELELFGALADIREIRRLFMTALGLKPEGRP
jgi:hypothetical protein